MKKKNTSVKAPKKYSIQKRFNIAVSVSLACAYLLLFVSSYILVHNIMNEEKDKYSKSILSIYSDLVVDVSNTKGIPITENKDDALKYGNYICKWLDVDYVYMYAPDIENNTITYMCVAQKDDNSSHNFKSDYLEKEKKYVLTENELKLWNREELFCKENNDNDYGHEITTEMLVEDRYGNKLISGIDINYKSVYSMILKFVAFAAVTITLVFGAIYCFVYFTIKKLVTKPVRKINQAMNDYMVDGKRTSFTIEDNGALEYDTIAKSFNSMTDKIDTYLENIKSLNSEQEHQKAEIDIASRIQIGFLPEKHYETFEYTIDAVMNPAKNIGGDLYDYIYLGNNKTLVVIADVSGKGISASMFMAITLVMIHQYASIGLSPVEILKNTNDTLAKRNPALLFATAFVGIFDNETNELTFANAGHNVPYIIGKELKKLTTEIGTPLGLFENEKYSQSVIKLLPGEILFLYTDGVNEAINSQKQFYGIEQLEAELKNYKENSKNASITDYITDCLNSFKGDVEQYDDVTMLSLKVKEKKEMILESKIQEFDKIKRKILELPLLKHEKLNFCLAAEECFVNICSYAYEGYTESDKKIKVSIEMSDKIKITFEDGGMKFNQLENISTADDFDIDSSIGGLGRFIIISNVDNAEYEYKNEKNILTLIKNIKEENK